MTSPNEPNYPDHSRLPTSNAGLMENSMEQVSSTLELNNENGSRSASLLRQLTYSFHLLPPPFPPSTRFRTLNPNDSKPSPWSGPSSTFMEGCAPGGNVISHENFSDNVVKPAESIAAPQRQSGENSEGERTELYATTSVVSRNPNNNTSPETIHPQPKGHGGLKPGGKSTRISVVTDADLTTPMSVKKTGVATNKNNKSSSEMSDNAATPGGPPAVDEDARSDSIPILRKSGCPLPSANASPVISKIRAEKVKATPPGASSSNSKRKTKGKKIKKPSGGVSISNQRRLIQSSLGSPFLRDYPISVGQVGYHPSGPRFQEQVRFLMPLTPSTASATIPMMTVQQSPMPLPNWYPHPPINTFQYPPSLPYCSAFPMSSQPAMPMNPRPRQILPPYQTPMGNYFPPPPQYQGPF